MTRLGPDKVAFFLRQHRDELARIWRTARASARPEIFPGLLDDVVPSFFDASGELLPAGHAPEGVWDALQGLVRWPPTLAAAEVKTEWTLLAEVIAAACESVHCDRSAADWLRRAAEACREGMDAAVHGRTRTPRGIVIAVVYSPFVPRRVEPTHHEPDA